jgi:hypothetical protein
MTEPSKPTSRGLEALIPDSKWSDGTDPLDNDSDDDTMNKIPGPPPRTPVASTEVREIRVEDLAPRLKAAKDIIKEQHSQIQSLRNKLHKLRMESL